MGTDIHIVVEIYRDHGWHLTDIVPSQDRNYRAFAVLADVRNGYGFAGFSTGDAVIPISEPRGLPDDMSPELRGKLEHDESHSWPDADSDPPKRDEDDDDEIVGLGEHSFSWVTLKELLDYDLDANVTVCGYVSTEIAERYRETGETPSSYCAWTSQPGFEQIEWQEPIRKSAWLIPRLIKKLSGLGDPENVRLVFGFDS